MDGAQAPDVARRPATRSPARSRVAGRIGGAGRRRGSPTRPAGVRRRHAHRVLVGAAIAVAGALLALVALPARAPRAGGARAGARRGMSGARRPRPRGARPAGRGPSARTRRSSRRRWSCSRRSGFQRLTMEQVPAARGRRQGDDLPALDLEGGARQGGDPATSASRAARARTRARWPATTPALAGAVIADRARTATRRC